MPVFGPGERDPKELSDVELVRAALEQAAMTTELWAKHLGQRSARNVRRWLAGTQSLPPRMRERLERELMGQAQ